uniref:Uncharacterized protein n=1 Tax=Jaculus jaculus TaxID=51337 RepID=A0A8C5K856_JACJA
MAPSEDPRAWRASIKECSLETSSDAQPTSPPKTIPTAHVTFIIDCANGKHLGPPLVLPQVSRPSQRPITPPMKTSVVFREETRLRPTQDTQLSWGSHASAKDTLSPYRGIVAPASFPTSMPCSQDVAQAKESPLKSVPMKSSTWGAVKGSLKALSSCVCGQAGE